MNYQIMRGGRVELQAIMPPQVDYDHPEKGDALYAFELSLSLEKLNNDRLIALHRVAGEADDANMQDFIEGELLEDQVKSIEEVSRFVGQLRRMGNKGDAVAPRASSSAETACARIESNAVVREGTHTEGRPDEGRAEGPKGPPQFRRLL